jgi:hypothetical protein
MLLIFISLSFHFQFTLDSPLFPHFPKINKIL